MLLINNAEQEQLITMRECIEVQEDAFIKLAEGLAAHRPRIDVYAPCQDPESYYRWGSMEGAYNGIYACRMKSDIVSWPRSGSSYLEKWHCVRPGTYCGLIFLFSTDNGEPLALLNDGTIQHMRVGGGAGIGAKHLARADASIVGLLGSGGMARVYLEAFCNVRPIKLAKVYSPTEANRRRYAEEMSRLLDIEVVPVMSANEAVRGSHILACCTDTMTPVFETPWLEPGMCVINVSAYEVPITAYDRFDISIRQGVAGGLPARNSDDVSTDIGGSPVAYVAGSAEQRRVLPPKNPHGPAWHRDFPIFADLALGRAKGRTSAEQITFYANTGNQGLQFAAVGSVMYRNAIARGVGRRLPTEWFLQDIRD
jgi:alanine dehydrogenase